MNTDDPRPAELDARLRSLMGSLDASAGFEERLMQRVATLAAVAGAPREDLRAQFEHRRALVRRRLRREAWLDGITIAGLGACAGVLLWRFAPEIQRLVAGATLPVDANLLVGGTLAALGAAVWLLMKRARSAR